jgi:hypothetical protein
MIKKLVYYVNPFTLFRKEEGKPNFNLRFMHGINRISVFMFVICLLIMLAKYLF